MRERRTGKKVRVKDRGGRKKRERREEERVSRILKPFHRRCCAGCHTPFQCPGSVVPLYWEIHLPHCSGQMLPQSLPTKTKIIRMLSKTSCNK